MLNRLFKRINRMIASMITRIVFCKFEWLWVVQWKSFESKIRNATQSVDYWLTAMYCETIAEIETPQRLMRRAVDGIYIYNMFGCFFLALRHPGRALGRHVRLSVQEGKCSCMFQDVFFFVPFLPVCLINVRKNNVFYPFRQSLGCLESAYIVLYMLQIEPSCTMKEFYFMYSSHHKQFYN